MVDTRVLTRYIIFVVSIFFGKKIRNRSTGHGAMEPRQASVQSLRLLPQQMNVTFPDRQIRVAIGAVACDVVIHPISKFTRRP